MIQFYSAQSLQTLLPVFAEKLQDFQQRTDAFSAPWVIVQNKETETWLNTRIAIENRISANLDFILPNQFLFKIYRQIDENLPSVLPTDRIPMQWLLLSLFEQNPDQLHTIGLTIPEFADSKIALAGEIADVFDLYQIYRPDMLLEWEKRTFNLTKDHWQIGCWQLLVQILKQDFPQIPFRSQIPDKLIQTIKNGGLGVPEEIFIVGVSHWNQAFNELITELSEKSTIHWFQHQLSGPDSIQSLFDEWVNPQVEVKKALLDTLNNRSVDYRSHQLNEVSPSKVFEANGLSIHSCHNPKREVEVLYQKLLSKLDSNSALKAEDILIMVPDLEEYLPHIESVFSDEKAEVKLPFQTYKPRSGHTEEAFLKLLRFFSEGEKVTQFLDVISSNSVKEHFNLSEDLLVFVEQWFEEMHIHNGLMESDSDYSIEKGVHQLFEGLLLKMPAFELYQQHVPFALPLRTDAFLYVAQLNKVFRSFRQVKEKIADEMSVQQWLTLALEWCTLFVEDSSGLKNQLIKLANEVSLSACKLTFTFDVFRNWVSEYLTTSSASATQFGTGIQISSYIPYRNIPFRYSAILGLNEGVFPRNPKRPNFDLIHKNPLPGDRITKLDDQLLFLERLFSTLEHVHISYIGEGENGKLVSPVVQQLIDSQIGLTVTKHKLHAFDEYAESKETVFATINTQLASKISNSHLSTWQLISKEFPNQQGNEFHLIDLISFFVDPAKYISTSKLGLSNVFDDDLLDDRQLFKLDGLNKYKLRERIEQSYPVKTFGELQAFLKYSGELPKGFTADKILKKEYSKVERMAELIEQNYPEPAESKQIVIEIDDFTLSGTISNICAQTIVRSQLSSVKGKHIVKLWIEFLAAQICSNIERAELYAFDKDQLVCHQFKKVTNPESQLKAFLDHFTKSTMTLTDVCMLPDLCWDFVSSDKNDYQKAKKLATTWEGSFYAEGLKENYYNKLLFREENPMNFEQFTSLTELLYAPIAEHWREVRV